MPKGFEVEVTGEYVARSGVMGKERVLKNYKIKCIVPSTDKVLSVIKNKILGPKLKKEYSDYVLFRTHHILSIVPLSDEDRFSADLSNIRYMSRPDLIAVNRRDALRVPAQLYPSLFKLREAVLFAANDPKGYAKHLDIHREDLEMDVEVAKLNPDLQEENSETFESATESTPKTPRKTRVKKNLSDSKIKQQAADRVEGMGREMIKDGEMGEMDNQSAKEDNDGNSGTPATSLSDI